MTFPAAPGAARQPGTARTREAAVLNRIDHVGIACHDLETAIARYESVFDVTVASREIHEDQGVREAMLRLGEGPGTSWIQLLEPTGPDTPVGKFLARRGPGIHHVGYRVANITAALAAIGARGVRLLAWLHGGVDRLPAPGRSGRRADRIGPAAAAVTRPALRARP